MTVAGLGRPARSIAAALRCGREESFVPQTWRLYAKKLENPTPLFMVWYE
jgi:hypothetical protein